MLKNPDVIKNKFYCGKMVAKHLFTHGFPLLGESNGNKFVFVDTPELRKEIENLPLYLKLGRLFLNF